MHIAYVNEQLKTRLLRDFKFSTLCLVEFNFNRVNFVRSCLQQHECHVCGVLVERFASNTSPLHSSKCMYVNNETFPETSIPFGQVSGLGRERTSHDLPGTVFSFVCKRHMVSNFDRKSSVFNVYRVWCDWLYISDRGITVAVCCWSHVVSQKIAIWEPIGPTVPGPDTIKENNRKNRHRLLLYNL